MRRAAARCPRPRKPPPAMTIFSTSVALDRPSAGRSRPAAAGRGSPSAAGPPAKKLVRVTRPRPPTRMSIRMITCPNSEKTDSMYPATRPVTQVALVAVNMASMTPSRPVLLEMGRVSSSVPTAMTSRKLMQMVCVALLPASQPLLGRRVRFWFVFPLQPPGAPRPAARGASRSAALRKVSRRRSLSL